MQVMVFTMVMNQGLPDYTAFETQLMGVETQLGDIDTDSTNIGTLTSDVTALVNSISDSTSEV